jgi:hypothetical protein
MPLVLLAFGIRDAVAKQRLPALNLRAIDRCEHVSLQPLPLSPSNRGRGWGEG